MTTRERKSSWGLCILACVYGQIDLHGMIILYCFVTTPSREPLQDQLEHPQSSARACLQLCTIEDPGGHQPRDGHSQPVQPAWPAQAVLETSCAVPLVDLVASVPQIRLRVSEYCRIVLLARRCRLSARESYRAGRLQEQAVYSGV